VGGNGVQAGAQERRATQYLLQNPTSGCGDNIQFGGGSCTATKNHPVPRRVGITAGQREGPQHQLRREVGGRSEYRQAGRATCACVRCVCGACVGCPCVRSGGDVRGVEWLPESGTGHRLKGCQWGTGVTAKGGRGSGQRPVTVRTGQTTGFLHSPSRRFYTRPPPGPPRHGP